MGAAAKRESHAGSPRWHGLFKFCRLREACNRPAAHRFRTQSLALLVTSLFDPSHGHPAAATVQGTTHLASSASPVTPATSALSASTSSSSRVLDAWMPCCAMWGESVLDGQKAGWSCLVGAGSAHQQSPHVEQVYPDSWEFPGFMCSVLAWLASSSARQCASSACTPASAASAATRRARASSRAVTAAAYACCAPSCLAFASLISFSACGKIALCQFPGIWLLQEPRRRTAGSCGAAAYWPLLPAAAICAPMAIQWWVCWFSRRAISAAGSRGWREPPRPPPRPPRLNLALNIDMADSGEVVSATWDTGKWKQGSQRELFNWQCQVDWKILAL